MIGLKMQELFTLNVLGVVSRFIKQEKLDKEG